MQLARTFEAMLVEIAGETTHTNSIEKEQQVYDIILHEIIRQVSVECADRGALLDNVSRRYRRLFARIPGILAELQQEIDGLVDANKSLRMLLERLMEEKSVIESLLNDTRSKDDSLAEQNSSYSAEIQRYKITIQHLIEERDSAIDEAKRQQERHYYQEKMNAELLDRDEFNKSIIKKMSEQLVDAINSLHEMEAKYLASIAQNRATRQFSREGTFLGVDVRKSVPLKEDQHTKLPYNITPQNTSDFEGTEVVPTRASTAPAEMSESHRRARQNWYDFAEAVQPSSSKQKIVAKKKKTPVQDSQKSPPTIVPIKSSPSLSSRLRTTSVSNHDKRRETSTTPTKKSFKSSIGDAE